MGGRAAREARARRRADGVSPHRILAADGHPARQERTRGSLAQRRGAVEDLVVTRTPIDPTFWRGKRILLTGHTGFKGAWMAAMLAHVGARVTGLALAPDTDPNLYTLARIADIVPDGLGDLREPQAVAAAVRKADPQIVLH